MNKKGLQLERRMNHHARAHEAAAAAAEAWKRAHPLGVGVARKEGSGYAGASGSAVHAAAFAAAAPARNTNEIPKPLLLDRDTKSTIHADY